MSHIWLFLYFMLHLRRKTNKALRKDHVPRPVRLSVTQYQVLRQDVTQATVSCELAE